MDHLYFAWVDPPLVPGSASVAFDGSGTGTMSVVAVASTAMIGDYRATCTAADENGGTFAINFPGGRYAGQAIVGTEFTGGGLTFTISDGGTDFVLGDEFTITVASAAGEAFDPEIHARNDEVVFQLDIAEREGEFAAAMVRVLTPASGLLASGRKRWAYISESNGAGGADLIFCGQVTGTPHMADGGTAELELIAQPPGWRAALDALATTLRVAPYYDALFFDLAAHPQPEDALAGRAAHYHWHRATGALSLVSLTAATSTIDLTGLHAWKSMQMEISDAPVRRIAVRVEAQWTQQASGETDITSAVLSAMGSDPAYVSTLTGTDFAARWPARGQGIGDASGYIVSDSSLTEVLPGTPSGCRLWQPGITIASGDVVVHIGDTVQHATGAAAHIATDWAADVGNGLLGSLTTVDDSARPLRSSAATVATADCQTGAPATDLANATRTLRIARAWFSPELMVAWDYRQARTERMDALVAAGVQEITSDDGSVEVMEFRLADITLDTTTEAWRTGIEYEVDDIVRFAGFTFRCLLAHTAGAYFGIDRFQGRWIQLSVDQSALGDVRRASFFQTDRGRAAFEHALARAAAKLTSSARCVSITVQVPWDAGRDITTAHSATISDPRLPGGDAVTGKVSAVALSRGAGGCFATITIALAVGDGATPSAGTGEVEVSGLSGMIYADYASQVAPEPVALGSMDSAAYVVREASASPDVAAQNTAFAAGAADPVSAVATTALSLRLRSLAADDALQHDIHAAITHAYSPPKQIDLGASS
ncbi:MAG TPA: hypothetical protein DCW68_06805 [Rhodospirillaceae bacterium]|nr:MAG: hypothetical protein A2018_01315 [Alphaproteobacteria bacterium GWF2_58_20]HAU29797.1 hypothetical protein [Rhodospirillaceae bacterium]